MARAAFISGCRFSMARRITLLQHFFRRALIFGQMMNRAIVLPRIGRLRFINRRVNGRNLSRQQC